MNPFDLSWVSLMFSVSNAFWIKLIRADVCWCCRPILFHRHPIRRHQCLSVKNRQDEVFAQRLWILTNDWYSTHVLHIYVDVFTGTHINRGELQLQLQLLWAEFWHFLTHMHSHTVFHRLCTHTVVFFTCQLVSSTDNRNDVTFAFQMITQINRNRFSLTRACVAHTHTCSAGNSCTSFCGCMSPSWNTDYLLCSILTVGFYIWHNLIIIRSWFLLSY